METELEREAALYEAWQKEMMEHDRLYIKKLAAEKRERENRRQHHGDLQNGQDQAMVTDLSPRQ